MWTKLREAAAAQAAFRSSSTRLKGEPQKTTIFSLFSKWRPKCGKKVHLFNVKSSPSLLAARWSSTFWNSRARWILRWNGKAGFGAISRRSRVKICLQKSGVDELTGFALKACRLCARVSPEPRHEDAHVQGEWRAKRWRWEKVDRSRSKIERRKGINKKQLKRCFLQYVSREVEQKCKCFLRSILNSNVFKCGDRKGTGGTSQRFIMTFQQLLQRPEVRIPKSPSFALTKMENEFQLQRVQLRAEVFWETLVMRRDGTAVLFFGVVLWVKAASKVCWFFAIALQCWSVVDLKTKPSLPTIYFPHYGTMCLAFLMIQLMPCLHLGNNNRHQVNFPQASLKHLRFEVTDEPDIPIPIWNICRTFVEDIRTCLWFKVFVVRTCLASVNGKMQSNLSAYFFARSATLKGFFANMNCHYVCEKNLVGFPRWWKPAK